MNKNEINYGVLTKHPRLLVTTLYIIAALTLSACSSTYTLSTNLDKENFKDYFSHSHVKVVEDESDFTGRYKLIGMVEGQNCQAKSHHHVQPILQKQDSTTLAANRTKTREGIKQISSIFNSVEM